jgi:hypothetical protein
MHTGTTQFAFTGARVPVVQRRPRYFGGTPPWMRKGKAFAGPKRGLSLLANGTLRLPASAGPGRACKGNLASQRGWVSNAPVSSPIR